MSAWTNEELARIGAADELEIAGRRADGTLPRLVIVWVVLFDGRLYVRSVNGRDATWFRGTQVRHEGRIRAAGIEKDVTFVDAPHDIDDDLDTVYRAKYRRYPANIVGSIVTPQARAATLEIVPL